MTQSKSKKAIESVLPQALMVDMLMAVPPKSPPAKRSAVMKQSLLAKIDAQARESAEIEATAEMRIVRTDEGKWFNFADNVAMKVLADDGDTRTWLARFQPGGRIPAHMQTGDEEAIILDGWCTVGEDVMKKGDYQWVPKGSKHGEIVSPDGCLIFVRSHSAKRSAAELNAAR